MVTFNVNGLRGQPKRRAVFQTLRAMKADLYFLQETHSTPLDEKIWLSEWGGHGLFCHGRSNARGVMVLFDTKLKDDVTSLTIDPSGRFVVFQLQRNQELYTMVNAYAPTQSERNEQIVFSQNLEEKLANIEVSNLFVGGDLNIQMDRDPHRSRSTMDGVSYATLMHDLMDNYNLCDIWKEKNPKSKRGTFHRGAYSARLDYWLTPTYLKDSVKAISIIPQALSDHAALKLDICLSQSSRGPGFWRFQNSLLADTDFTEQLTDHINEVAQEDIDDPSVLWDWIKYKIRAFCIQYTIKKNRDTRRLVTQLEDRLKFLAEEYDLVGSEDVIAEVNSIKRELSEIAKQKATASMFRSKARWAMLGEKPTAYF